MKTALVTGASRGIGKTIALRLGEEGLRVWGPGRSELDLLDPQSVTRFVQANRGSSIDVIVNNAGINELAEIEHLDDVTWGAMFQVNVTAPMSLVRGLTGHMRSQGWGRIVNVSSIFSLVSKERRAAYSATKAALNAFTRAAAVEFGKDGVLVNAVCPGYVETELTRKNNSASDLAAIAQAIPLGRLARPDEIAGAVQFLCSEENTYITGQAIVVDGGFVCR